jgi:hypothetical protein
MKKVKLKSLEQIQEENGVRYGGGYAFKNGGIVSGDMMYMFGGEVTLREIPDNYHYMMDEGYDYVIIIDNGQFRFIREDWIDYPPSICDEISSIFDDILEDL